jgi:hypothetical protein
MMMLLVCSIVMSTGIWGCSEPMPVNVAVASVIATNETFLFTPGKDDIGPPTLFRTDPNRK